MFSYFLFLDTETSGVPSGFDFSPEKIGKWPYILQISWIIYDLNGLEVKRENHYINAGDIRIAKKSQLIHGINKLFLKAEGKERREVIQSLLDDLEKYNPVIVGHFLQFDLRMLEAGLFRAGLDADVNRYLRFCTMKFSTNVNYIKGKKYSRLAELYKSLFGIEPEFQHNSLYDAVATAQCFFELRKRKMLTDEALLLQSKNGIEIVESNQKNKKNLLPLIFILVVLLFILTVIYGIR